MRRIGVVRCERDIVWFGDRGTFECGKSDDDAFFFSSQLGR